MIPKHAYEALGLNDYFVRENYVSVNLTDTTTVLAPKDKNYALATHPLLVGFIFLPMNLSFINSIDDREYVQEVIRSYKVIPVLDPYAVIYVN